MPLDVPTVGAAVEESKPVEADERVELGPVFEGSFVVVKELGGPPDDSPMDPDTDGAAEGEVEIASVRVLDASAELPRGTEAALVFEGTAEVLAATVPDGVTGLTGGAG